MSIKFNLGSMKVREDGELKDINMIIGNTSESIEAIKQKGDKYLEDIDIKGTKVIESIPEDYESLSDDVTNLKEDLTELDERQYNDFAPIISDFKNELLSYVSGQINHSYDGQSIAFTDEKYYLISTIKSVIVPSGMKVVYAMYSDTDESKFVTGAEKTADFDLSAYRYKYVRFCIRKANNAKFTLEEARTVKINTWNYYHNNIAIADMASDVFNAYVVNNNPHLIPKLKVGRITSTGITEGARSGRYYDCYIPTNKVEQITVPTGYSVNIYYYGVDLVYKTMATKDDTFVPLTSYPYCRLNLVQYSADKTQLNEFNDNLDVFDAFRVYLKSDNDTSIYDGDLCPKMASGSTTTSNGITYKSDGDGISVNGTATAFSYIFLWNSETELPQGIKKGHRYLLDFNGLPARLNITIYHRNNSGWVNAEAQRLVPTGYKKAYFTIPNDAVGLRISVSVNNGFTMNEYITPRIYDCESLEYAKRYKEKECKPMLTIIYDDGLKQFKDYILPIIQSKKVPIATAIINTAVDSGTESVMTYDEIVECYRGGAEILVHSKERWEDEWGSDANAVASELRHGKHMLNSYGCNVPNAYIYSAQSAGYPVCRKAVDLEFECGFDAGSQGSMSANLAFTNYYDTLDRLSIKRRWADANWTSGEGNDAETILKSWVDELINAKTGWQVWCRHNYSVSLEPQYAQTLSNVIDYALSNGVEIVTIARGMQEYLH